MKRLIVVMAVMLMVVGMVSVVRAADPASDTMTLTVTVGVVLDVTIFAEDYDFGNVQLNATTISTTSTAVKNSSTNAIETYTLKVSPGATGWTIANSTGTEDEVRIQAMWNTTQPSSIPDNTLHNLDEAGKVCNGSNFGGGTSPNKGVSVPTGVEELLWFKLWTPSESTEEGVKKLYLTIVANLG